MSGRTAKQEQERISPNHVPTIFHFSVLYLLYSSSLPPLILPFHRHINHCVLGFFKDSDKIDILGFSLTDLRWHPLERFLSLSRHFTWTWWEWKVREHDFDLKLKTKSIFKWDHFYSAHFFPPWSDNACPPHLRLYGLFLIGPNAPNAPFTFRFCFFAQFPSTEMPSLSPTDPKS